MSKVRAFHLLSQAGDVRAGHRPAIGEQSLRHRLAARLDLLDQHRRQAFVVAPVGRHDGNDDAADCCYCRSNDECGVRVHVTLLVRVGSQATI